MIFLEFTKVETTLAETLASVYSNIPWSKIKVSNAYRFYKDRVYACTNCADFKQFLDKLCLKCNVSFVRISSETIEYLEEYNDEVMGILRKENTFIVNYALDIVEERKQKKEE